MPYLSDRIKRKAKELRKSSQLNKKLTELQNELAVAEGFNSFKHLVTQEQVQAKQERSRNAKSNTQGHGDIVLQLNQRAAVFVREDGHRGLKALEDIKEGEVIFTERPFLWLSRGEDRLGEGFPWALTRNIAVKLPDALNTMVNDAKLQPFFKPKLNKDDQQILANIVSSSRMTRSEVRLIYNLVSTYNAISSLMVVMGGTIALSERITISAGISYTNHSCEPNASRLKFETLEEFKKNYDGLVATKPISKGEEITWSYFEDSIPNGLKNRRKTLLRKFGFICTCTRCIREERLKNKDR